MSDLDDLDASLDDAEEAALHADFRRWLAEVDVLLALEGTSHGVYRADWRGLYSDLLEPAEAVEYVLKV